jgi:hypothetical protein
MDVPVLASGDRVIVSVGIKASGVPGADQMLADQEIAKIRKTFAGQGVHVLSVYIDSRVIAPAVIAIFRGDKPA